MEVKTEKSGNKTTGQLPSKDRTSEKTLAKDKRTIEKLKILRKERFNVAKAIKGREPFGKNDEQTHKLYAQLIRIEKKIALINSSNTLI